MHNREEMVSFLQENVCEVEFTKKNGEKRLLTCTLNMDMIEKEHYPKESGVLRPKNLDVIAAFDLEKQAWRSFRVDSVNSFRVTENVETP